MTTLQLNQEVLRQIGYISNDDNLLTKVINYIKSIIPARSDVDVVKDKKNMLDNILSMPRPCPLTDEEINKEVEKGRQEFYDNTVKGNEGNH